MGGPRTFRIWPDSELNGDEKTKAARRGQTTRSTGLVQRLWTKELRQEEGQEEPTLKGFAREMPPPAPLSSTERRSTEPVHGAPESPIILTEGKIHPHLK